MDDNNLLICNTHLRPEDASSHNPNEIQCISLGFYVVYGKLYNVYLSFSAAFFFFAN